MIKGKYPPTPENPRIWPFCGGGGAVLIGTLTGSGSCMALSGGTWVWRDYVGAAGLLFSGNGFLVKSRRGMPLLTFYAPLFYSCEGRTRGYPHGQRGRQLRTTEKTGDMEFKLIRSIFYKKSLFFTLKHPFLTLKYRIFLKKSDFLN